MRLESPQTLVHAAERIAELEAQCAAMREALERAERDATGWRAAMNVHAERADQARAKAIENAAKVALECDWLGGSPEGKYSSLRETIAAAIRAMKDGGT